MFILLVSSQSDSPTVWPWKWRYRYPLSVGNCLPNLTVSPPRKLVFDKIGRRNSNLTCCRVYVDISEMLMWISEMLMWIYLKYVQCTFCCCEQSALVTGLLFSIHVSVSLLAACLGCTLVWNCLPANMCDICRQNIKISNKTLNFLHVTACCLLVL